MMPIEEKIVRLVRVIVSVMTNRRVREGLVSV